jgi:type II secretory pathway pseudopilin PulG
MKSKRGFLLAEETLKLVIAVIAIGILAYFLVSLYFSSKNSKELEQAEASLTFLIDQAKAGSETVDIYNPNDWWIFQNNEEICICKGITSSSCEDKGICLPEEEFSVEGRIQIVKPPITLSINQENMEIGA